MATDNKYDRQIRLWGPVGQRRLGTSSVLLVGTSASGTETAKNLVLPGVGALEILDDAPLPAAQSANFFLPASNSSSICAASAACSSLAELNSDVACSFRRVDDLARLGDEEWAAALAGKSLAVGADLPLATLRALSRACAAEGVPLVAVRAYGLIGYVRIQTAGAHDVVETRREGFHPDLRVRDPFPELRAMAGAVDWDDRGMDAAEHAHVPFVLILVEALRRWRKERTDEAVPRTAAEKKELREVVRSLSFDLSKEMNFTEALERVHLCWMPREDLVDFETRALLDSLPPSDPPGAPPEARLLRALRRFAEEHRGYPPLAGTVPDMTSTTERYVALQAAYRARAGEDAEAMRALLPAGAAGEEELRTFCKNCRFVRRIATRSAEEELAGPADARIAEELRELADDPPGEYGVEHVPLLWLVAVRACELYQAEKGVYPGGFGHGDGAPEEWGAAGEEETAALAKDAEEIWSTYIPRVLDIYGIKGSDVAKWITKDHAVEVVRYFAAEVHNISAVVGGVAAQEAVKLITKQFVPMDNTYVFNGIASVGGVYRL